MSAWETVRRSLKPGQKISNWTLKKGLTGDDFHIIDIERARLLIEREGHRDAIPVYQKDFDEVGRLWTGYLKGEVPRKDFIPLTFKSKYVISILHHINYRNG